MKRMWAAGAAVLLCLALGVPALAQEPSESPGASPVMPTGPALVEGTMTCQGPGDTRTYGEGWFRGNQSLTCHTDLDDPRVAGPGTLGWNYVCYPAANNGCIYWGDVEIDGPGGTWSGSYSGVDDQALWDAGTGGAEMLFELSGSGDYEGWSFVFHVSTRLTATASANGFIYEGALPPWPLEK
jgi:hypothetical protein